MNALSLCILGCGNIGSAIAIGLKKSGQYKTIDITPTRRKINLLDEFKSHGFHITDNNGEAIKKSEIIIIAVGPHQLIPLLQDISSSLNKNHLIISIVSGVEIEKIQSKIGIDIPIIRAMPNTAADLCESMTCLSTVIGFEKGLEKSKSLPILQMIH